jgi:hypothetical protein
MQRVDWALLRFVASGGFGQLQNYLQLDEAKDFPKQIQGIRSNDVLVADYCGVSPDLKLSGALQRTPDFLPNH